MSLLKEWGRYAQGSDSHLHSRCSNKPRRCGNSGAGLVGVVVDRQLDLMVFSNMDDSTVIIIL